MPSMSQFSSLAIFDIAFKMTEKQDHNKMFLRKATFFLFVVAFALSLASFEKSVGEKLWVKSLW